MKHILISILVTILFNFAINAQSDGKRYINSEDGYSFTAPSDWTANSSKGKASGFILANPERTIGIYVLSHNSSSLAKYVKNEASILENGFKQVGNLVHMKNLEYAVFSKSISRNTTVLETYFIPFSDKNGIVLLSYVVRAELMSEANEYVVNIIKSLKLEKNDTAKKLPAQSSDSYSSSESTSQNSEWGKFLLGKKLETFSNGSSRIYRLCGGGRFSSNGQALSNTRNGTASIADGNSGRWQVQGNRLVLRYSDGRVINYELGQGDDRSIKLNGTTYLFSVADCS